MKEKGLEELYGDSEILTKNIDMVTLHKWTNPILSVLRSPLKSNWSIICLRNAGVRYTF